MLLAHVKWYVDDPHHPQVDARLLTEPVTLALIGGAVVVAAAWWLIARRLSAPELPFLEPLGRLAPWIPRLLGVHLGVSLLSLAVTNAYLAPHLSLDDVPGGSALALLQGVVGVWLVTGVRLRPAALAVVALGPLGLVFTGPLPVVEAVDTLGVALFLAWLPPGPDRYGARWVDAARLAVPVLVLRVGAGVALIVLAFSEKLLAPGLARELIARYPEVDVFRILGVAVEPDALRGAGRHHRAAVRPAPHQRGDPAGRRADRRGAVQPHAAGVRPLRADRAPADLRRAARPARVRVESRAGPGGVPAAPCGEPAGLGLVRAGERQPLGPGQVEAGEAGGQETSASAPPRPGGSM